MAISVVPISVVPITVGPISVVGISVGLISAVLEPPKHSKEEKKCSEIHFVEQNLKQTLGILRD